MGSKTYELKYLDKEKRNQKSRALFFATLHYNILKSKNLESCHGLLELELNVG